MLKSKIIVALGEGLKSISDVGLCWDGSVHRSAQRGVVHFTETMNCCGCDPCTCKVWHGLDQPGEDLSGKHELWRESALPGREGLEAEVWDCGSPTSALAQLTYGHKDIIYLVVGFCRCLHEQDAFGPCKLFPLLVRDKQSYSPSPL